MGDAVQTFAAFKLFLQLPIVVLKVAGESEAEGFVFCVVNVYR